MSKPKTAKAGDVLTAKAQTRLLNVAKRRLSSDTLTLEECTVKPKSNNQNGQHFCIDCGEFPQNNLMAQTHAAKHRTAWLCFTDTGLVIEEN